MGKASVIKSAHMRAHKREAQLMRIALLMRCEFNDALAFAHLEIKRDAKSTEKCRSLWKVADPLVGVLRYVTWIFASHFFATVPLNYSRL
ncbi:hypothetical protein AgCh_025139 [Apium graveolens]